MTEKLIEMLKRLVEESYGALAWLQGSVQLSDRARAYKVTSLADALSDAEAYLQIPFEKRMKGDKEIDKQPCCAKCEDLKRKAQYDHLDRIQEAYELLAEQLMEVDLEHERGKHAEDSG